MRLYYAHCIAIYSTPQEDRDIETLEELGFTVVNPNSSLIDSACERVKAIVGALTDMDACYDNAKGRLESLKADLHEVNTLRTYRDGGKAVMDVIFKPLVLSCDALAFRGLPDGRIPAGVLQEILWARDSNMRILELPSNLIRRQMTVDETREYLREIGSR